MKTKETIAIIGATGELGASVARNLSKDSYRLILMSKEADKLDALVKNLSVAGSKAFIDSNDCAKEVSWEADIIIVAAPYETDREVAEKIRDVATGKVVISISNPLNRAGNHVAASPDTSAAEELQKLLPYSKVVKAFNMTLAAGLHAPVTEDRKTDVFIAANSGNALEVVSKIVASAGFNPVVVGDLSVSRSLDRMQLSNLTFIPTFGRQASK